MSQWGRWSDELDSVAFDQLALAYMTRKRWEANLLARSLGEALGGGGNGYQEVSVGEMLGQMGVTIG